MTDAIETEFTGGNPDQRITTYVLNVLADNGTKSIEIYKKGGSCFARQWLVERDDSMFTVTKDTDI